VTAKSSFGKLCGYSIDTCDIIAHLGKVSLHGKDAMGKGHQHRQRPAEAVDPLVPLVENIQTEP
jgi:hypothetical protein